VTTQYQAALHSQDVAYEATKTARDNTYQQASAVRDDAYKQLMAAQQKQDFLGQVKASEKFLVNLLQDTTDSREPQVRTLYNQALVFLVLSQDKPNSETIDHLNTYRTSIK
jgi:hypothetical protein